MKKKEEEQEQQGVHDSRFSAPMLA